MRRIGIAAVVLAVCTACGAGPSIRPDVAVVEHGSGSTPTSDSTPDAPALQTPTRDLAWSDCTAATLTRLGLGAGPAGLVLECGGYTAPIDPSGPASGAIEVGALRARLAATPADAAPLVLTSGSDVASATTLAALAAGPAAGLLERHPIVAVDRRGTGSSTPIDCGRTFDRRVLADLGQSGGGLADADRVAEASRHATTACTDTLQPAELAFDTSHAADDLEQLRRTWQVDRLGLIGTGNGASVTLAYAAKYPDRIGRLVLDSPPATTANAATVGEQRVQGQEAALTAFARRCAALACSLGPDPTAAVTSLRDTAAAGGLGTVSASAFLTTITAFLGSPRSDQPDRVRELSDILAAAGSGDLAQLTGLVAEAETTVGTDGQFVARCSDGQQWPGPGRVRELQTEWGARYPTFGSDAALALLRCSAWPTTPPAALPSNVPIPVLVLSGAADPIVGNAGLPTVTGTLTSSGAKWSGISWEGYGHPVTTHSDCARQFLSRYLESGALPPNAGVCPA